VKKLFRETGEIINFDSIAKQEKSSTLIPFALFFIPVQSSVSKV